MTEIKKAELLPKEKNITDNILNRYNEMVNSKVIDIPKDYSAENALKSAWFMLQEVEDSNKKPALEVCTKDSISNSLFEMVVDGLNPMKKQCYFIVYGKKLTLLKSYQGNIAMAKRYSNVQSVIAREIYEKDVFVTEILKDGREVLVKHEQPFENTSNKIIGGYCIVIDSEGKEHLTKMTLAKINKSWMMGNAKGKSKLHTDFDDEAVKRTLINRACKPWINSSNDENIMDDENEERELKTISIEANEPEKPTLELEPNKEFEPEIKEPKPEVKSKKETKENPY